MKKILFFVMVVALTTSVYAKQSVKVTLGTQLGDPCAILWDDGTLSAGLTSEFNGVRYCKWESIKPKVDSFDMDVQYLPGREPNVQTNFESDQAMDNSMNE